MKKYHKSEISERLEIVECVLGLSHLRCTQYLRFEMWPANMTWVHFITDGVKNKEIAYYKKFGRNHHTNVHH